MENYTPSPEIWGIEIKITKHESGMIFISSDGEYPMLIASRELSRALQTFNAVLDRKLNEKGLHNGKEAEFP